MTDRLGVPQWRQLCGAVTLLLVLSPFSAPALAQVTTFSDRAAWNAAAGAAAIQTESLNGFVTDTTFRGTAATLLNMTIEEINGPTFNPAANFIDASPFEEDGKRSPNGTTYVLGEADDSGALIRIDFASPVTGWGADFVSHDGSLVIDVFDQSNSLIGTTTSVALETTFYGFHLGAGQTAKRIELKFIGLTNDLFGMDDLSFTGSSLNSSAAVCEIQLNGSTFGNGEAVTAQVIRFANTGTTPVAVEYKVWLEVPSLAPYSVLRGGADGSAVMPAGLDTNIGPFPLFTVVPQAPRGEYAFNCRLVDPVTGELKSQSLQSFVVE